MKEGRNFSPKYEAREEKEEHIVAACVTYKGNEYLGRKHSIAMGSLIEKNSIPVDPESGNPLQPITTVKGFKTNMGRFVDRAEAMTIARRARQLTEIARRDNSPSLASEDLEWVDIKNRK